MRREALATNPLLKNERKLIEFAVDYWLGLLDHDKLILLLGAMQADRRASNCVMEIGAALDYAGVIDVGA